MTKKQSRRSEFIKFYDDVMRKGTEEFGWDWHFGNDAATRMLGAMNIEYTGDNWQERAMAVCITYAILRAERKFLAGRVKALANEFISAYQGTIVLPETGSEDIVTRTLDAFCDWVKEKYQEKES